MLTDGLHELAHTLPRNPSEVPGSGAAGGLAGGLWAQFDAQVVPGADFVLDTLDFDEVVRNGSALVVGEGRLDSQTQAGKIISALVRRSAGLPVFAVVGSVGDYTGTDFAEVITATDTNHLRRAGAHIAQRLGVPA